MSGTHDHTPDFFRTTLDLGLGLLTVGYVEREPQLLSNAFDERLGFAAKYLARAADLKRSQAYEVLARSGGFSNWHHLSEHLKLPGGGNGSVGPAWFESLCPLMPLLAGVDRELPLASAAKALLEAWWGKVAAESGSEPTRVMDEVGAAMLGEKTWEALSRRSPLDATTPLYGFDVEEGGREGHFHMSRACSMLVERLDDVFQGYGDMPKREQGKAGKFVEDVATRRPDFLEGQLAWAEILRLADSPKAEQVLDAAISGAEALMPAGFKGRVRWSGALANRFYHRLLWMRFSIHRDKGRGAKAAASARKMLRLNPDDNFGVRFHLPLVLLQSGKNQEADRACVPLRKSEARQGDITAAILAFVAFANGSEGEFRRQLLRSLFTWPLLRAFLLNEADKVRDWDGSHRWVRPDYEDFAGSAWPAYLAVPELRRACFNLVARRDVVAAEKELARMWFGFWRVHDPETKTSSREEWMERMEHHIEALAR